MSFRRLLLHTVVLLAVAAMVTAGFWQLHRLSERRERNSDINSRSQLPIAEMQDLVGIEDGFDAGRANEYRLVRAVGVYQPQDQVLIRNRTYQGAAGFWALTPMRLLSGEVVAINRGWIPHGVGTGALVGDFAPGLGVVEVTGLLRSTVTAAGLQQADPAEGVLTEMARPDLARLEKQLDADLLPAYMQLQAQTPPAGELPIAVPAPEQREGSHLAYAVQWFIFAAIALVGYPLILRRLGRPGDAGQPEELG